MTLSSGKSILLFRFHKEPEVAAERIKILKYFNPTLEIHVLFGGQEKDLNIAKEYVNDVATFWHYPDKKDERWKWRHTDLMLKAWYNAIGKNLDFDFLYSYEYDLLTLLPLEDIYPDIDDNTLALAACEPLTPYVENLWTWTSKEPHKANFVKFCNYMNKKYGLKKQAKVCLGPGPLLPKKFMQKWAKTEDIDYIHDEIAYPAYAEALGFKTVDHGMHPGFGKYEEQKYFTCRSDFPAVNHKVLRTQLSRSGGRRTFHPVKELVTLEELLVMMKRNHIR